MQRLMAVAIFVMMFTLETGNCLSPASGQSSPQARDSSLALVGARVYPSPTERPISNAVVLIKNGRISAVGQNGKLSIPPGTRRIDCSGLTLTAGFWNSHVHLAETKWENASTIPAPELTQQLRDIATRYGFTTVFDTGSVLQNTKIIHQRIESGEVDGPRILTTGPIFYPKGGVPPTFLVQALGFMLGMTEEPTDPDQARSIVAQKLDAGADAIKIYAATWGVTQGKKIPVEVVRAITTESHKRGKLVLAHPSNAEGLAVAIDGGVDVLLHTAPDSGSWNPTLVARMIQKGIALVPTLKLFRHEGRHGRASFVEQRGE